MADIRQRFFVEGSPVRGEVVQLTDTLQTILAQRPYPEAVAALLGEMLTAAALLASTLKINGRLSIQAQGQGDLRWAMAECTQHGELRALAECADDATWPHDLTASEGAAYALKSLGQGVLFINIEPEHGENYQGIIPLEKGTLAECLTQYYDWSVQIPTQLKLASTRTHAGGLLVQLLPRTSEAEQETVDTDLWPRLTLLTQTMTADELQTLEPMEVLRRLYYEEDIRLPDTEPLKFGCTCSRARCEAALQQVGRAAVEDIVAEKGIIEMDCQFCNTQYRFNAAEALGLFGVHLN